MFCKASSYPVIEVLLPLRVWLRFFCVFSAKILLAILAAEMEVELHAEHSNVVTAAMPSTDDLGAALHIAGNPEIVSCWRSKRLSCFFI